MSVVGAEAVALPKGRHESTISWQCVCTVVVLVVAAVVVVVVVVVVVLCSSQLASASCSRHQCLCYQCRITPTQATAF